MKRLLWNKHSKRLLKLAAGWFCIGIGFILLITPGQGILTILLGIYLLADDVPFFGKIKAWIHQKFPKAAEYAHRKSEQLKAKFHRKK